MNPAIARETQLYSKLLITFEHNAIKFDIFEQTKT